jgi:iron complex transport system ATP-binding protein
LKTNDVHNILTLKNLSIGYGKPLLTGINAEIKKGEIVLLAGKNGSGKTTLLKTIFKEINELEGKVKILDKDLYQISFSEIGRFLSVVLSKRAMSPSLKVLDLLELGRYPYKKWYQKLSKKENQNILEILALLDLEKYKNFYLNELSDGNLQKALIGRALVQDCPLMILDEPTSHLDVVNKLKIINLLRHLADKEGKTILFTSHDLNLGLSIAEQLWLIKDGQFYAGSTEDTAQENGLYEYFSDSEIAFDYNSNEYSFRNGTKKLKTAVAGNSKSIFWLKKALLRNQIDIQPDAKIIIFEKDSFFEVQTKNGIYKFLKIEEVVDFLINLQT